MGYVSFIRQLELEKLPVLNKLKKFISLLESIWENLLVKLRLILLELFMEVKFLNFRKCHR